MTVLITGGAGYIGSHMVWALLDAGERVVVVDNLSTGFREAVPAQVPLIIGDFGDEALVAALLLEHKVDAIIHFAAKIVVPESIVDPLGYYGNNTAKARTLIACAVAAGVKNFIFSSTAAVYGEPTTTPVGEDAVPMPMSPYGRSKLMVEWMLEDVAKAHPLSYTVLRYFNVAGADPQGRTGQSTPDTTHLIKVAVQTALGRRRGIDVYGADYPTPDGSCVRDYIHVSDLVQAHRDALARLRDGGGNLVCNIGYGTGFSVFDVIKVVKSVSGVDFHVNVVGRRSGDPAAIVASNVRARRDLGWTPKHEDLEGIVRSALDWERRLHNI